jgi:hypothetical protein
MEKDAQAVRARVDQARSIADAIAEPLVRARCEAVIATLDTPPPVVLRPAA